MTLHWTPQEEVLAADMCGRCGTMVSRSHQLGHEAMHELTGATALQLLEVSVHRQSHADPELVRAEVDNSLSAYVDHEGREANLEDPAVWLEIRSMALLLVGTYNA